MHDFHAPLAWNTITTWLILTTLLQLELRGAAQYRVAGLKSVGLRFCFSQLYSRALGRVWVRGMSSVIIGAACAYVTPMRLSQIQTASLCCYSQFVTVAVVVI